MRWSQQNDRKKEITTAQYNQVDDEWGLNFRLNYIYRSGDDFFFIFNRSAAGSTRSWSLSLKLTHTFDF